MDSLPDNLILIILEYLPVKDRCICGRVCRRWRRIVNDNSLWRHVDLSPYRLNLKKTWKVLRSHFSECLLTVKLRGYVDSQKPNWKSQTLSNAQLEDLRDRCPNIRELHLYSVNTENIDASKLPQNLVKLTVSGCVWTPGWMKTAKLPNIQCLDVSKTSRIDKTEATDFCRFATLEELYLNSCYRISEDCIKMLAENLMFLKRLELADTQCTDLALHHVSRKLPSLVHLNIGSCDLITDSGMETVASGLKQLTYLDVSRCEKLTDCSLNPLRPLKSLRILVCGPNLSGTKMEEFQIQAPQVDVQKCLPLKYDSVFYSDKK